MIKLTFSQPYLYIGRESVAIKYVTVSVRSFHCTPFCSYIRYTQQFRLTKCLLAASTLFVIV